MPAPMAPRPPPTPRAIALPALRPSSACGDERAMQDDDGQVHGDAPWLVVLGDRAAEVDRGQGGEDERLQRGDQADLEEEEGDRRSAAVNDAERRRGRAGPTSPPPMNRMSRWPARMLAKRRTESEMSRMKCEMTSMHEDRSRPRRRSTPAGIQALEVADDALGPDALDVVADPHDERRAPAGPRCSRSPRRARTPGSATPKMSNVCSVFVGSGM